MIENDITIRKAIYADAQQICNIKRNSFMKEMTLYNRDANTFMTPPAVKMEQERILNVDGIYFNYVVESNNKIIGGCTLIEEENHRYYIRVIYIGLNYQNMGIGTKLFNFLFNSFSSATSWYLETPYKSYRNHHFYEKLGFKRISSSEPEEDGFFLYTYEYIPE